MFCFILTDTGSKDKTKSNLLKQSCNYNKHYLEQFIKYLAASVVHIK